MKLRLVLTGAALALALPAYAGFTPIALDPSSFNRDPVVENTAPLSVNDAVTATMDGGTNKNGNTWYERGYNPAAPTTGLPVAGSLITNAALDHVFQMPPDYHVNNVILVGKGNGGQTPVVGGTLVLTAPATYNGALSFLTASGGATDSRFFFRYTIHFEDGSTDSGSVQAMDWFNSAANVYNCAGRVSLGGGVQNVGGSPAGALFAADVFFGNTSSKIVSIDFEYDFSGNNSNTNNNGRAMIFAVSGLPASGGSVFLPIAVTGYNHDGVVEADGPQTTGTSVASAGILTNYVSVTMDGGESKINNCWYEKGYYASYPDTGIPAAGSTITSAWYSASYTMPPTYVGNCAAVVYSNCTSATITFATPAAYGALSFLGACANGDTTIPCVISFQDGTKETNAIFIPDWFNRVVPWAYLSHGRVNPNNRTINNTPDQFVDPLRVPFPFQHDYRNLALPTVRLFDCVINVTNTASPITDITLSFTSGATSTRVAAIFAVSGAPAGQVPPIFGATGSGVNGMPNNAPVNNISLIKRWEGTNTIVLAVTNIAGSSVSYQWKKAPRGGGLRDKMYSFDYSTFTDVVDGGRISGANSRVLTIANALTADSADYLCVASNPYGTANSTVATLMMLSTNQSLCSGVPAGDVLLPEGNIKYGASPAAEAVEHAFDRVAQKWLSDGLQWGGACCGGPAPFVGPVGYGVTPIVGRSVVTGMRFYTANDSSGRDPMDYGLEGSNDGGSTWNYITGGKLIGTLSLPANRNSVGSAILDPISGSFGTNNFMVEVNFANTTDYKSYRVTVTNVYSRYNNALMQIAEIELLGTLVSSPPVWVRQPEPSSTVYAGASPVFVALATGYPNPTYQWYKGTTPIPGATTSSYTFPNAQLADSGTTFKCDAINRGGTITSSSATLTVVPAPTQPYPVAVLADAPIGYWRFNEAPDNGAGNNGMLVRDYWGAHNGYYSNVTISVLGYNPLADTDSAASFGTFATPNSYVANIRDVDFASPVNGAPKAFSIEAWAYGGIQTPNAALVTKGYNGILTAGTGTGTEQFALDMTGTAPNTTFRFFVRDAAGNAAVAQSAATSYDTNSPASDPVWHHLVGVCDQPNGKVYLYVDGILAGSGNIGVDVGIQAQPMPMTIGARKQSDASEYNQQWLGVIDDVAVYDKALSPSQVLSHYYGAQFPPIITLQPTNTVAAENVTVTFYSSAYGAGTLGYQWYRSDGTSPTTPVPGQTAPNLSFTTAAGQNGNYYQLVVTNQYGAATGAVAQLTVLGGAPSYVVDLPSETAFGLGHIIRLEVIPGGTAPFTYQWKKDNVNLTDNYRISGSQSSVLIIGYATNADAGNYQVVVTGQGSTPSTACAVTITTGSSAPPFTAAGTGWTMQGTPSAPVMTANRLELTSGLGSTARSAWVNDKINVGAFNASFIYQTVSGAGGADGVTFCLQNQAVNALGGGGGSLGYSGITPSVALALNIYASNTRGIRLLTGGALPAAGAGAYFPVDPVLIGGNANPVQVNLNYSGGVLAATFKDTVTAATYTTNITVDIPAIIGAGTAWVGFTGADGGTVSTQIVTDFSLAGQPFAMKKQHVGSNLILSWPATAGAFLKQTPTLTNPVWTDCTAQFRVVGNEAQVTITPLSGTQFYRLIIMP